MSSSKRTKIPKKPILTSTTTKVVSGKVVKSLTPQRAKPKQKLQHAEVSAIHPVAKNDKKEKAKVLSESDNDIIHTPLNPIQTSSNENSFSSTQSNQSTLKKDTLESLKKQINDLSKFSFQQSQLINKFHADLIRAELVTGSSDPTYIATEPPDQFNNLGPRLHFLIENFISQTERLKKIGGIDQAEKQYNELSERALKVDEICQQVLGSNYTIDSLLETLQEKQDNKNIAERSIDLSSTSNLDVDLGKQLRGLYNDNDDNDSIISQVKGLNNLAESMKAATGSQDNDINSLINNLKNIIRQSDKLKAKNDEIQRENANLQHLLKDTQENSPDQQIISTVKSFYQNNQNTSSLPQSIEQDLELSHKVRSIFESDDNNDAILRTIQSNKESAEDNARVAELTIKLQQLQRQSSNESFNEKPIESDTIQNLKQQYKQELAKKDTEIIQLTQENNYFKSITQKLNEQQESIQKVLSQKNSQIEDLTQLVNEFKAKSGSGNDQQHQQEMAEKDALILQLQKENGYLNETVQSNKQLVSAKETRIIELTQENGYLKDQAQSLSSSIQKLRETVETDRQVASEKDGRILELTQENGYLRSQSQSQANSIQSLNEAVENGQKELSLKNTQISDLAKLVDDLKSQVESSNGGNSSNRHPQENGYLKEDERRSQIEQIQQENGYLKEQVENLTSTIENLKETADNRQKEISEKDSHIVKLKQENGYLKSQQLNQNGSIQSLTTTVENRQRELSEKEQQITQLAQENVYLKSQIQNQINSIQALNEERENHVKEITQKREELEAAYSKMKQNYEDGINEDEQRKKDAELSTKVREVFSSSPEEDIIPFIKKDVELASKIRFIYQSGDDIYILHMVKDEHTKNKQILEENENLTLENNRLKSDISEKHKLNEQKEKENDELRSVLNNTDDVKNKEIEYLKKKLLESLDKQKELENKLNMSSIEINNSKSSSDLLKDEISQHLSKIEQKENEINQLKQMHENQLNQLKNEMDSKDSQSAQRLNEIEQKQREIDQLKNEISNKDQSLNQLKNEISSKDQSLNQLKNEIDDKDHSLNQLKNEINSKDESLNQLKNEINSKDESLNQLKNEISEASKKFQSDNLFESVTNIFHPDLSVADIKSHSEKVAQTAEQFFDDSDAKEAIGHLFESASGENLRELVEQMKNDPDESVRKNAEVLSDVLKDSRMSVEAEGMITATLAMFLQQIGSEQQKQ